MKKIIELSINLNVYTKVLITAALFVLGIYCTLNIPIQLFPSISKPVLSIQVKWSGASGNEVEAELIQPVEILVNQQLGVQEVTSSAVNGGGSIDVTFRNNADMKRAYINLSSELSKVKEWPRDADLPKILYNATPNTVIGYFFVTPQEEVSSQELLIDYIDNSVIRRLEAVNGVSRVEIYKRPDVQIQIKIDPFSLSNFNITLSDVIKSLDGIKGNSSGAVDLDSKEFIFRTPSIKTLEEIESRGIRWQPYPVRIKDIAKVDIALSRKTYNYTYGGKDSFLLKIESSEDANFMNTIKGIHEEIEKIEKDSTTFSLDINQSYNPSVFIERSLSFLGGNLVIGFLLSGCVVWFALKYARITLLLLYASLTSGLIAFICFKFLGKNINIISLAGFALSIGMLIDCALVVVYALIKGGSANLKGRVDSISRIFPVLLSSTLTTVVVFLPFYFSNDVASQLFQDFALSISIAIISSFFVSIFILPSLYSTVFAGNSKNILPVTSSKSNKLSSMCLNSKLGRYVSILSLLIIPIGVLLIQDPKIDYLPDIKRDAVDTYIRLPAGTQLSYVKELIANPVNDYLLELDKAGGEYEIKNFYILAYNSIVSIGVRLKNQESAKNFSEAFKAKLKNDYPNLRIYGSQGSLLDRFGGSNNIELHMKNADIGALSRHLDLIEKELLSVIPGASIRIAPNISEPIPELQILPNYEIMDRNQFSQNQLNEWVGVLGNGLYLGMYSVEGSRYKTVVNSEPWGAMTDLLNTPIVTGTNNNVILGDLAFAEFGGEFSKINRVNGERSFTFAITPPEGYPLQDAIVHIGSLAKELLPHLPDNTTYALSGSVADFNSMLKLLNVSIVFSVLVLFTIAAYHYKSLLTAFVLLAGFPVVILGGYVGFLCYAFFFVQPLNIVVLFGFIALLGIVTNNIMLLIDEVNIYLSSHNYAEAISKAVSSRSKIILVSTFTSIFGMAPLALSPSVGSEMYAGMAVVIIGGMTASMLSVYILIPVLLSLVHSKSSVKSRCA